MLRTREAMLIKWDGNEDRVSAPFFLYGCRIFRHVKYTTLREKRNQRILVYIRLRTGTCREGACRCINSDYTLLEGAFMFMVGNHHCTCSGVGSLERRTRLNFTTRSLIYQQPELHQSVHLLQSAGSKDSSQRDHADFSKTHRVSFCLSSKTPKTSPLSLSMC